MSDKTNPPADQKKKPDKPHDPREAFLTPFPRLSPKELDEWTAEAAQLAADSEGGGDADSGGDD